MNTSNKGVVQASRYHDFSCGHRVVGHESKCRHLHGHNYRVHFYVQMLTDKEGASSATDSIGRVMDFSVIKEILCEFLEREWDHKFLMWEEDPMLPYLGSAWIDGEGLEIANGSLVAVPFNPTAENMAQYLVEVIGPALLSTEAVIAKYGRCFLQKVEIWETRKCMASFEVVV